MHYVLDDYDDALGMILRWGVWKTNRTGVRTKAVFGIQSRYPIDKAFPVLTGRKLPTKAIWAELLWFLSGSTNNQDLVDLGANIWTPWVDPEFEKKNGYAPGCFGPVYGFQLRHFNGYYGDGAGGDPRFPPISLDFNGNPFPSTPIPYGHGGVDQLADMVKKLKETPDDRRILFSLWNPAQTPYMKLPPCHILYQCFVHEGKLTGMLTQRSCDFPIGVPFNIAFYSALTVILAQQCGLEPWEFVHSTADSHIYEDQIPAIQEYLERGKPASPRLVVKKAADIYSYKVEDFQLEGYDPQPAIKIPVAV